MSARELEVRRLKQVYYGMLFRCSNPNSLKWSRYGGRGIRICDRWCEGDGRGLANFLVDMGDRPAGMSLDRRDNDGDYEPGNCRWATRKQQQRNTSRSRLLTFGDVTKALPQWAEDYGIPRKTLQRRLERGWELERSLTTEVGRSCGRRVTA